MKVVKSSVDRASLILVELALTVLKLLSIAYLETENLRLSGVLIPCY